MAACTFTHVKAAVVDQVYSGCICVSHIEYGKEFKMNTSTIKVWILKAAVWICIQSHDLLEESKW